MIRRLALFGALALASSAPLAVGGDTIAPAARRFAAEEVSEVPDFQRHVLPLMGRVGCNTRSCHGSFQGQGGLRLSLFGYDFKADHETLLKADSGRVTVDDPEGSMILSKPTLARPHKGGKRLEEGTWQHRLLTRWIESGAKGVVEESQFDHLEVTPAEVVFREAGQKVPLRVVAHWEDGTSEDVTCLSRFRTNDESIAEVGEDGVITSTGKGDTHVVAFYDNGVAAVPVLRPVSDRVGERYPEVATPTKVDELIVAKLRKLGIVPSPVCSDAEFLRRVSLDMTGTLPTPDEVSAFLADGAPGKRAAKVDELLARPTYAAWWATKLGDFTGNTSKTIINNFNREMYANDWYQWLYRKVGDNVPYDKIAAGLIMATSRKPGQSYDDFAREQSSYYRDQDPADYGDRDTMPHYWERTNFRKPEERTIGISYAFLGVRLECAQCHKHPFDQWTQDDFNRFGAFFSAVGYGLAPDARPRFREMNEELGIDKLMGGKKQQKLVQLAREGKVAPFNEVFVAPTAARPANPKAKAANNKKNVPAGRVVSAKVLGGDEVSLVGQEDPRALLMEWLRGKDNPYFARAFVNRVWATYFGSGIVNPPDDMNLANPPSNAPLLDYLAEGFVDHGFDMKWLHREIANTQAYQRSWQADETNRLDERNFSRAVIRRVPAEALIDAVTQATASSSVMASATTKIDGRAIGSRSGLGRGRNAVDYTGKVFGVSTRETNCDCNRSNDPNLLQSIYMQNDTDLWSKIDRGDGWIAEKAKTLKAQAAAPQTRADASVAELEKRIKEFRADNARSKRVEKLEARLEELREAKAEPKKADQVELSEDDRASWAREAYLRTLGRAPTADEAATASAHLASAPEPVKGLRDLLWALLNTKEFVTNH